MAERKGASKVVWIILFTIITVLLCYLFTVIYFYFISPYNIALKLGFWPFSNTQSIGEMYMDSVVQINYKAQDEQFNDIDVNIVGVNVKQNGVIIAPLSEFSALTDDAQINIFTNKGTAYKGTVAFQDTNRNLAILKCQNVDGSKKKIKIPYVGIGSIGDCSPSTKVIMTAVGLKARALSTSVTGGVIVDSGDTTSHLPVPKIVNSESGHDYRYDYRYDYTLSYGFVVQANNNSTFSGGAVFNRKGKLLGLSFGRLVETNLERGESLFMPVYGAKDYIGTIGKTGTYKNELVDAFCGFDTTEAKSMLDEWSAGRDTYYFDHTWNNINDEQNFKLAQNGGFYLFKEFNYKENTIAQKSIITKVKVGGKEVKIDFRVDLIDTLFKAKAGDKVVLTYDEKGEETSTTKTISFTV